VPISATTSKATFTSRTLTELNYFGQSCYPGCFVLFCVRCF